MTYCFCAFEELPKDNDKEKNLYKFINKKLSHNFDFFKYRFLSANKTLENWNSINDELWTVPEKLWFGWDKAEDN